MQLRRNVDGLTLVEVIIVFVFATGFILIVLILAGLTGSHNADAVVKEKLHVVKAQAETFGNAHGGTYAGFCSLDASEFGLSPTTLYPSPLKDAYQSVAKKGGFIVVSQSAGQWNNITCHDTAGGWAVEAPLSSSVQSNPVMWCVDSRGSEQQVVGNIDTAETSCP